MIVPASLILSLNSSIVLGPMSTPSNPAGMSPSHTRVWSRSSDFAATQSTGSVIFQPTYCSSGSAARTSSSGTFVLPTLPPRALRNTYAIFPPTSR